MNFQRLTRIQKDVLREIGNIGAGNAATSMAKLLNKKIDMNVPSVAITPFEEVMDLVGGPDTLIVSILFRIEGEAPGTVYFILTTSEAQNLLKQISGQQLQLFNADGEPEEFAVSALQEIGNILTGSYLSALSDFTHINMQPSVPYFSIDMAGAILTVGLLELSHVSDYAIIIDTKINEEGEQNGIQGQFFLLPDPDSFTKIFHALGISGYE